MRLRKLLGLLTALLLGAPVFAQAQYAYTAGYVHLRAGPGRDYPVVAVLPAGFQIYVEGCIAGYSWCDVLAGPNRGWVYAAYLLYPYQGTNVPIIKFGAVLGLGILGFSIGEYWDHHYRGRPWYSQRRAWINRPRSGFGRHPRPPQAPAHGIRRPPEHAPVLRRRDQGPSPRGRAPARGRHPPQMQAPHGGPASRGAREPRGAAGQRQRNEPGRR